MRSAGRLAILLVVVIGCGQDALPPRETCLLLPDSVAFGPVYPGRSKTQPLLITSAEPQWRAVTVRLMNSEFTLVQGDSSFHFEFGPGQTETVMVHFAPATLGRHVAEVQVDGLDCGPVLLTGQCVDSPCRISSEWLAFGHPRIGETETRTFTVRNGGPGPLVLDPRCECRDFHIGQGDGMRTLEEGDSLDVTIEYSPTVGGESVCVVDLGADECDQVRCTAFGMLAP